jgi:hypothetical protein
MAVVQDSVKISGEVASANEATAYVWIINKQKTVHSILLKHYEDNKDVFVSWNLPLGIIFRIFYFCFDLCNYSDSVNNDFISTFVLAFTL